MSQGTAASYRLGPWTGMLLALLVAAPSAAEEASFDLAAAVTGDAGRRPYTLWHRLLGSWGGLWHRLWLWLLGRPASESGILC